VTEQINTPPSIQRDKQTLTGAKGTGVEMNDAINEHIELGAAAISVPDPERDERLRDRFDRSRK
jgi:hypothetical protein